MTLSYRNPTLLPELAEELRRGSEWRRPGMPALANHRLSKFDFWHRSGGRFAVDWADVRIGHITPIGSGFRASRLDGSWLPRVYGDRLAAAVALRG